jgi:hypothetical protein
MRANELFSPLPPSDGAYPQFQILRAIIIPDSVFMVHRFTMSHIATKFFFHYKTMFIDIVMPVAIVVSSWMVWRIQPNVSLPGNDAPSLPKMVVGSCHSMPIFLRPPLVAWDKGS